MGTITVRQHIDAPCADVFAALTDLEHAAERIGAIVRMEVLTDGPIGVGTRFRETRVMFKREATEEMEITAFDPPRAHTVECRSCGGHYTTVITCTPDADGTMVEMAMSYRAESFMAKLMAPLGKLMAGTVRKCFQQDLRDIKSGLEPAAQPA